ncbi:polyhydroxyalkanoate depolymerase [Methylobacterium brachythecii]|uniref:Esterase n=1 Tax=Methylobacterium brachythecii TaxID=1176177 RepID=A0A7W6ADM9_9HYPH|nr:polyhydroxyalkanoate depolymerase [Methylobacterium brachythecii]MBB3901345.1 polyhydroxyalkanoate depolymerase [Methylobacterium brachythecii]GLS42919.1 esterase [Methylobacterium brachythecii]
MLYLMHEARNLMLAPMRMAAEATKLACENAFHPLSYAPNRNVISAGCEMFERTTRSYPKPAFDLPAPERIVWEKPFCRVLAFGDDASKPKMLLVAPMSGHYATLLRGTVAAFVDTHQVFITDWTNAREVPLAEGAFGLSDYIDYCIEIFEALGPDLNVTAVCQPSVPVVAAIARMEEDGNPLAPRSAVLIGGPIDTRCSPTSVNAMAQEKGIRWFEQNCIQSVPHGYRGASRSVYPGFMQLVGFMSMNPERHSGSHWDMFDHLVAGDGESAEKHRRFYDEYLAVMDLTAEFYLETVEKVFIEHALPKGELMHHDRVVDLGAIRECRLMAIEGEKDDITGIGQTRAVLDLAANVPADRKAYHLQPDAGHYGIFNGSRFRAEIVPQILAFTETDASRPIVVAARGAHQIIPQETRSSRFRDAQSHAVRNEHRPSEHHWHRGVTANRSARRMKDGGSGKRSTMGKAVRAS